MSERILVTGGAGFIGSHLCDRLLAEGHWVFCLDNLLTGSAENIAHLQSHPRFRFISHDVTEPIDLEVQRIFHMASPASPKSYLTYAVETALANSLGTYRMLQLAVRCRARFLFTSTSEVYGDPLEHPQREEYWGHVNPIGMRSCYDESKRFGETLTLTHVQRYDLDARIVRIFNTYGPRSDPEDGRVVPNFVTQAIRGEPITVYGTGQQTRSLCYVADLVEGIWRAMFYPRTAGEVINLGSTEEHTVLEFAELIRKLAGSQSSIVFRPPISSDDPARRRPDIAKARERLGWEPKITLEEGLRQTVEWFRGKLS